MNRKDFFVWRAITKVAPAFASCGYLAIAVLLATAAFSAGALRADTITDWSGVISTAYGTPGNWSNGVPNGAFTAIIPGGTPFAPITAAATSNSVDNLTLSTVGATMTIGDNSTLQINAGGGGAINNAGTLNLSSIGNAAALTLSGTNGTVSLSGAGVLQLSNQTLNRIDSASTGMTLMNSSTIQGAGQFITGVGLNNYNLNNSGTITAAGSAGLLIRVGSGVTNTGTLQANGGTLTLQGDTYTNTGGLILANTGSAVNLLNSTVNGGTLQTLGTGVIQTTAGVGDIITMGSLTIASGSNVVINDGSALHLAAGTTLTNNGTITQHAVSSGSNLILVGAGTVTLSGSGTFTTVDGVNNNQVLAANAGSTLVNDVNSTISGSVQFNNGGNGISGFYYVLTNNGTIDATNTTAMQIFNGGGFTNNGTLEAAAGSDVNVIAGTPFTNFSGTTLTGGTYEAGGTIQIAGLNIVHNAATILLTGAASAILNLTGSTNALANFADNTAAGIFSIEGGRNFTSLGAVANAGMLTVGSTDMFVTGGSAAYTQSGGTTQDDGLLTAAGGIAINGGTLKGTGTVTGNVTVGATGSVNPGDSPGTLSITGNYNNSGTLDAEFSGTGTASGLFDVLNVSGVATLTGSTLDLIALAGFNPVTGEQFDILNYASHVGTFGNVLGTNLGGGYGFSLQYNPTDVVVTVTGPVTSGAPEPGTFVLFGLAFCLVPVYRKLRRKSSCN